MRRAGAQQPRLGDSIATAFGGLLHELSLSDWGESLFPTRKASCLEEFKRDLLREHDITDRKLSAWHEAEGNQPFAVWVKQRNIQLPTVRDAVAAARCTTYHVE